MQFSEMTRWVEIWFVEAFMMQGVWPVPETMVRVASANRIALTELQLPMILSNGVPLAQASFPRAAIAFLPNLRFLDVDCDGFLTALDISQVHAQLHMMTTDYCAACLFRDTVSPWTSLTAWCANAGALLAARHCAAHSCCMCRGHSSAVSAGQACRLRASCGYLGINFMSVNGVASIDGNECSVLAVQLSGRGTPALAILWLEQVCTVPAQVENMNTSNL